MQCSDTPTLLHLMRRTSKVEHSSYRVLYIWSYGRLSGLHCVPKRTDWDEVYMLQGWLIADMQERQHCEISAIPLSSDLVTIKVSAIETN